MQKQIIFTLFLFFINYYSSAQCTDTLYIKQVENKIKTFKKEKNVDSLVHYTYSRARCWQEVDSLEHWLYLHRDLALAIRHNNYQLALHCLDTVFVHPAYREPHTKAEKKTVLIVNSMKGYLQQVIARRYIEATETYEKALVQYQSYQLTPKDFKVHEFLYKPLGNNYVRLGDNEKAKNMHTRALEISLKMDTMPKRIAGHCLNVGIAYANEGKDTSALDYYKKGLTLKGISDATKASIHSRIAESYLKIGNNEVAKQNANEALSLLNGDEKNGVAEKSYQILATIALKNKKTDVAEKISYKSLNISKKVNPQNSRELGKAYHQHARILTAKGKYQEAAQATNRALTAVIPTFNPQKISDLPSDSLFYNENTIFEALSEKANTYAAWYTESKDLNHLQIALQCHELALESEFRLRNVYQYESSKLNLQAHTRQRTEKAIEIAYLLYQKTNDEQYINRAFRLSESSRAVLLLEGISKNFIKQQALSDTLFSIENELKRQQIFYLKSILTGEDSTTIAYNTAQKIKVEKYLDIINKKIEQRYPQYNSELNNRLSNISIQAVKNALPPNTDMVEYFQTNDALYAFKINQKNTDFIKIKTTPKDINTIKTFLTLFEKGDIRDYIDPYATLAHEVYQIIYKPLSISTDNEVVIIPEGILSTLPFDALLTSKGKSEDFFSTLPYLLLQNHINYAYSATIFLQKNTKNNLTKNKGVLALAPVFKNTDKELSKSEQEVDKIIKILSGKSLKHGKATQQAFTEIAPDYKVIHLSTHANAGNSGQPPQIEFSDKVMFLPELYTLQLNAELVVLSACETAIGKHEQGEGVMSLARGFRYSGVPRLVTSLWKVNDAATADIMVYFYQNLKAGMVTDKALHQAKLNYLNATSDFRCSPYYWSGFVHIGQPSRVSVRTPVHKRKWLIGGIFIGLLLGLLWWRRKK